MNRVALLFLCLCGIVAVVSAARAAQAAPCSPVPGAAVTGVLYGSADTASRGT